MPLWFTPGLMDRLLCDRGPAASYRPDHDFTLDKFKDAIAHDLEALLNTRAVYTEEQLDTWPECRKSVLNYGLIDFAGMCLASDTDRARICAALQAAIERHEPRLRSVVATLEVEAGSMNRVGFVISAILDANSAAEAVKFDAVLHASTQQYSIRQASTAGTYDDGSRP